MSALEIVPWIVKNDLTHPLSQIPGYAFVSASNTVIDDITN